MTSTLKWGWALILVLCASFAYADPPARVGRLNYVHGAVSLAPAQTPDAWSIAALNRPLTSGDRLWTDRDGYAEFHVGSTAVRLAPRTNVDVLTLDDDTLQLRLAQGDVNLRVRDVRDDDIEVSTPNGAVLLEQAGSYRISTDAAGDTTSVIVHHGRAQVLAPSGAVSVHAGQRVTFHGPDGAPSDILAAHRDPFDNWSAELDRREDQIAATRYVSPHMTGYEDLDAYGTWRTMPEYGAVWVPRVTAGWAPYRHGHWVWIEPWGWTWVDDAPWGFAPFHYGRWVWLNGYWAWAPGPRVIRPVYAPALVAFVGGSSWSVSIGSGPAVGWFPLGWREPYFPWYRTSPTYVRNVNVTHVQNITVYNDVTRINYRHRARPQAVTVVPREAFVSARPVPRHLLQLPAAEVTRAPLVVKSAPAEPAQNSFAARRAETRPPETAVQREVFATRTPRPRPVVQSATAAESSTLQREAPRTAPQPRVRVIERQRADDDAPRRRAQGGAAEAEPRSRPVPGPQSEERRGPAMREEAPRAAPGREVTPSAPRRQQPEQANVQRERGPAVPPVKPQAAQERPRAEADKGPAREQQAPQKRADPQPQSNRGAARSDAQSRGEAQREQRPAAPESRQRPEPRSQATPGPRAEPSRPQRVESRANAQRPPQAGSQQPAQQRAQPQRPEPRTEARSQRAEQSRPPQAAQQRVQPPRPEARGPQNAPAPRAGSASGRNNRERRDRD